MRVFFLIAFVVGACTHKVALEPIVVASTPDFLKIEYYHGEVIDYANSIQNTISSGNVGKLAEATCAELQKRAVFVERVCLDTDRTAKFIMCTEEHYTYACH